MAVDKKKLLERHNAVRAKFKEMRDAKKWRYDYIIKQLAEKYYYSEKRIEEIIAMNEHNEIYQDKSQLNLFTDEG